MTRSNVLKYGLISRQSTLGSVLTCHLSLFSIGVKFWKKIFILCTFVRKNETINADNCVVNPIRFSTYAI